MWQVLWRGSVCTKGPRHTQEYLPFLTHFMSTVSGGKVDIVMSLAVQRLGLHTCTAGDMGWSLVEASPTPWTWVWATSTSWRSIGKPGILQSMGSQKVGHDWATELNWRALTAQAEAPGTTPPFSEQRSSLKKRRHLGTSAGLGPLGNAASPPSLSQLLTKRGES